VRLFLTVLPLFLNPFQAVMAIVLVPVALRSSVRQFESFIGGYTDQ
jgi:hypothetical protein